MIAPILKSLFLVTLFFVINFTALQSQVANQNININILGDKSGLSVNYERIFCLNEYMLLGLQSGVGMTTEFTLSGNGRNYLTMPSQCSIMFGLKNVYLEIGAKGIPIFDSSNSEFHLTPFTCIRLHSMKRNAVITRVHYSMSGIKTSDDLDILATRIGISLGVTF